MSLQRYLTDAREAGCDEAGRGCLAGPVVAAAVILPEGMDITGLDDSKRLTPRRREQLAERIRAHALWAVAEVDTVTIDSINILQASILAMHRALDALDTVPAHIAVDGNRFKPWRGVPHTTVVHGDALLANIAAASILAKTHRDALMQRLHTQYPAYAWNVNKGYPTRAHRQALLQHGVSPWHRRTFAGVRELLLTLPGL